MIESNARTFNKKNKKVNQKKLRRMKLHKSAPELAQGIQQLYLRAQDPELIAQLKSYQNSLNSKRLSKKKAKKNKKH